MRSYLAGRRRLTAPRGPRGVAPTFALVLTAAALAHPAALAAQRWTRPERQWTTLETRYFRVHAPREFAEWARSVAGRLDAVREVERRVIGFAPAGVTDVVVDDPYGSANGSAFPFLHGPTVFLWPVPPTPRSFVGNSRDWGELLAVHEFAHIAHLTRPARNRLQRTWRRLLPEGVGPIATRTPRWAIEGYATYVEGALTGSGRPHAALRAAVLRGWALDGALPSYGALNGGGGYLGGSFAYLMGSAYLEWLGARGGDSSITAVWRRSSARVNRSFDAAFAGVYGEGPATLYGRFTAQLTADAFALRARLDTAGRVEGVLDQRLAYTTGDPALSRDGRRMAVELSEGPDAPSRLVVWRVGPGTPRDTAADSAEARSRRRLLRRDPEDVPAVRRFPRPRQPVAVLLAANGATHHTPRFFADGRRVLVSRSDVTPDEVVRPDLFVWDTRTGRLTRATRGANVRDADPAPDGRSAAAVRCEGGRCDLVRVDLGGGAVRVLARGAVNESWTRPRWSPDGRRLVAGVQRGGRWRLALVDAGTGAAAELLQPDDAERYDASFTPDGRALVYTSERGGVPNVVRRELGDTAERPLTRVATAAFAPTASAAERAVYFLHLTPTGLDLRRVAPDSTPVRGGAVALLADAATPARDTGSAVRAAAAQRRPRPDAAPTYATAAALRERPYGAGPRHYSLLPLGAVSPDGGSAGAQLAAIDPVGRLSVLVQGAAGDPRTWRGGSLRAAWRGLPVTLTGELFAGRQALGGRAPNAGVVPAAALAATTDYRAATIVASAARWLVPAARPVGAPGDAGGDTARAARPRVVVGPRDAGAEVRVAGRLGASAGRGTAAAIGDRGLAFAELSMNVARSRGESVAGGALGAQLAAGRTAGAGWQRLVATGRLYAGSDRGSVALDGAFAVVGADAPAYEQPLVGGATPLLFDAALLSQRLAVPALPTAARGGRRAAVARASLGGPALNPYVTVAGAGDGRFGWTRLAGVERRFEGPFAPFARLPRVRLVAGVARVFDAPLRGRTRGYLSATFTP
jgi:hypothetical protein